ncbi:MAG: DUF4389 domain-containing protein [SAR86 cluster bacterium]|nr:DUF4389 domain-containing protein [SAR86 cluster bacterium]
MTKKEINESIDTEELKENVVQGGKWIRILLVVLFCIVYTWAELLLWLLAVLQFLFHLFTNEPNKNLTKVGVGFRSYMVQIINYVTYQTSEKPFPFSTFPKK